MVGTVKAIARKAKSHAAMELIDRAEVTIDAGIEGDFRGTSELRQVTVLASEDWQAAIAEIARPDLPWTTRRANILVSGLALPHQIGARLQIGSVVLEVAEETEPCSRMEAAAPGLRAALTPDWRGGVACRVIQAGTIAMGDQMTIQG
jgi:MOSC domain-containing protein YiiM